MYVRRLADHEAQVAEIQRDILESQNRRGAGLVALDRRCRDFENRQRNPALDSAPGLEELEMQIDGRLELGILRPKGTQLGRFPGFGPGASSCACG